MRLIRSVPDCIDCDKFFSSNWLDPTSVIFGSKNSSILVWNVMSPERTVSVPLPYSVSEKERKGVYTIEVGPYGKDFVVNSHEDIILYSLPNFTPISVLRGHIDTVFDVKYLNENYIVSGGKDGSIRIWNLDFHTEGDTSCLISRREHMAKVRALGINREEKKLVSVSPDNSINIWDLSNLDVINNIRPRPTDDMVCVTQVDKGALFAIGSMDSLIFIDIRMPNVSSVSPVMDTEGIRSIECKHSVVITGGAGGYLNFFDVRKMEYLESNGPYKVVQQLNSTDLPLRLEGAVRDNEIRRNYFNDGNPIKHAIFSISLSPNKTQIIAAGGPLTNGLEGSLATLMG